MLDFKYYHPMVGSISTGSMGIVVEYCSFGKTQEFSHAGMLRNLAGWKNKIFLNKDQN